MSFGWRGGLRDRFRWRRVGCGVSRSPSLGCSIFAVLSLLPGGRGGRGDHVREEAREPQRGAVAEPGAVKWPPIGRPARSCPIGTVVAGMPVRLASHRSGAQSRHTGSTGSSPMRSGYSRSLGNATQPSVGVNRACAPVVAKSDGVGGVDPLPRELGAQSTRRRSRSRRTRGSRAPGATAARRTGVGGGLGPARFGGRERGPRDQRVAHLGVGAHDLRRLRPRARRRRRRSARARRRRSARSRDPG